MTAGSEEIFQKALPYLRPRPDPYTRKTSWRHQVSPAQAEKALRSLGLAPRSQDPPQVLERTASGRVFRVRLMGVEVRGPEAQRLLRLVGLPSALADFQGFEAVGQGVGHGVGLSQWGPGGWRRRASATGKSWAITSPAPPSPTSSSARLPLPP
jgi:stage II sporulation protein D